MHTPCTDDTARPEVVAPRTTPADRAWPLIAHFAAAEARFAERFARTRARTFAYEFARFGCKQAWACLFGGAMVALIVASHLWYPAGAPLARYDALFVAALALQALLLATRMETPDEAKVILVYHVIGTAMEVFKTGVGSWSYPEAAIFSIGGVPLFSGFMYAAIGSYIARCWRLFDFRFTRHPKPWAVALLAFAIYANFYTHHRWIDLRIALFAATALLFARTEVHYRIWRVHRRMPLLLGFLLVASFIWIAENLGTLTHTWTYPHQAHGWTLVRLGKLGSWFLLLIVSYALVAMVNRPRPYATSRRRRARPLQVRYVNSSAM
ncbi:uncharacterized membrane protein YoaT (DUF817 family) [Dokdonella fugitiva]|uniref:Uncharacterized membrane protein YoaT (DUF817 family) n=1 Tax=Dokdonella fugitiva TaxID=328517 RepID=A0A839EVL4_9GAMM|nr:DUF817 domain-containing protein [Dokdonella fugitiva]MBA8888617.1 uncharacterized membrane protein YoaT (DUF817 family) [Dokdonella fugitiva]